MCARRQRLTEFRRLIFTSFSFAFPCLASGLKSSRRFVIQSENQKPNVMFSRALGKLHVYAGFLIDRSIVIGQRFY